MRIQRDKGSGPPLENHKLYGFLKDNTIGPPPRVKVGSPLENVGPPNLMVFFEINHWSSVNLVVDLEPHTDENPRSAVHAVCYSD